MHNPAPSNHNTNNRHHLQKLAQLQFAVFALQRHSCRTRVSPPDRLSRSNHDKADPLKHDASNPCSLSRLQCGCRKCMVSIERQKGGTDRQDSHNTSTHTACIQAAHLEARYISNFVFSTEVLPNVLYKPYSTYIGFLHPRYALYSLDTPYVSQIGLV